jgi:hypothetical protein
LWGLLGKAPPDTPKLKLLTPPPVPLVPVRIEPERQAPQPTINDLVSATNLDELGKVYDSLVKRFGYDNELVLTYTTRMFQLSEKENQ